MKDKPYTLKEIEVGLRNEGQFYVMKDSFTLEGKKGTITLSSG
ncbi:hypothetical protein SAMN04488113_1344 [Alkalibacterium gilvum]|uniref:Uncharacterized protein n=1 Tax=Alkalibacterium gilvum TaxID=1130080 RepID=A0A1H6UWT7_9LACT|nr:hypothetical protein [Alkalibacterium gilvum]SEI92780.1 hypothetical protein SAMN04488113_1344 [Alkalibacterium gilvum]